MAQLDIVDVGHAYAPGAEEERWALKPLKLTFESGKTYALVGPSGCGKTTLLNILSGLVRPSRGRVLFDGVDVTALPTKARNIAQVFQFPVIYKSMTVYDNLAFPLQCRRWAKARTDAKVRQVAEALDLQDRLGQSARGLTADDKQLISLGRGLVRDDVAAVLMDEPLTVIDPQLKHSLRRKIREITEQFRPTVIYVTHDQYEAMSFAQELLVMKDGRAVQQGTPEQLFEAPSSTYVGYFIGSPAMNFLTVDRSDGPLALGGLPLSGAWDIPGARPRSRSAYGPNTSR
ncbi:ABC transporter ATP-binding protein [Streptomyces sp. NBC_00443]|uniref:ABC transporter ATP-binding protein n=1 Tax=Streptomyces sp. NBC_00443 TaxID=2975743 RepID=UPI002E1DC8C4